MTLYGETAEQQTAAANTAVELLTAMAMAAPSARWKVGPAETPDGRRVIAAQCQAPTEYARRLSWALHEVTWHEESGETRIWGRLGSVPVTVTVSAARS